MTTQIDGFAQNARAVGLPQVLTQLARFAQTPLGKAKAQQLAALRTPQEVAQSWRRIAEAQLLWQQGVGVPMAPEHDIEASLQHAEKGGALEGIALWPCAVMAQHGQEMAIFARTHAALAPTLAAMASIEMQDKARLCGLQQTLSDALDADGRLLDSASALLQQLRSQARQLRQRIRSYLEEQLIDIDVAPLLQDRFITVRHDRFCLPVIASFQARMPGIVHNASQTGQTLFIEPQAVVTWGNEVTLVEARVRQEEIRLLQLLSAEVADVAPLLRAVSTQLTAFDVVQAAARLGDAWSLQAPELVAADMPLRLCSLRHPLLLLAQKKVVANDVVLQQHERALLLSGPNAGGKTAILSACGLAWAMARVGLPIAAAATSQLPFFTGMFVALGDGQDLQAGLSTFSAHLRDLDAAHRSAGPGWLVLIDEIGAATDPLEGAALARAVMVALVQAGARLLVSTHLEALKALPLQDARFVNARMLFLADTFAPTYRLQLGASGRSYALSAAARLPMDAAILEQAHIYVREHAPLLSDALARVEDQQQALYVAEQSLKEQHAATAALQTQLAAQLQAAKLQLAQDKARQSAQAAEQLAQELAQWRRAQHEAGAQQLARAATQRRAQAQQDSDEAAALQPQPQETTEISGPLSVGQWVYVPALKQSGTVRSLDDAFATVAIGAMQTRVARNALRAQAKPSRKLSKADAAARTRAQQPRVHSAAAQPAYSAAEAKLAAPGRIDLRGLRVEQAHSSLQRALDVCLAEGAGSLWIVHGHGTGALREQVRAQLQQLTYTCAYRDGEPHEGGQGVTIVSFDAQA